MQIFSKDKTYNFMKLSPLFLIVLIFLFFANEKINHSTFFNGEVIVKVKYENAMPTKQIEEKMSKLELFKEITFDANKVAVIHFLSLPNGLSDNTLDVVKDQLAGTGVYKILRVDVVGAKIGTEAKEVVSKVLVYGLLYILLISILLYIVFRFKHKFRVTKG